MRSEETNNSVFLCESVTLLKEPHPEVLSIQLLTPCSFVFRISKFQRSMLPPSLSVLKRVKVVV